MFRKCKFEDNIFQEILKILFSLKNTQQFDNYSIRIKKMRILLLLENYYTISSTISKKLLNYIVKCCFIQMLMSNTLPFNWRNMRV